MFGSVRRFRAWVPLAAGLVSAFAGVAALVVSSHRGTSDQIVAFNSCVRRTGFLKLSERGVGQSVTVAIYDRSRAHVVGKFAALPSASAAEALRWSNAFTIAGGSAAREGRFVLFIGSAVGRDARAITRCGAPLFPTTP